MKKAQMEIMGLAIIVILVSLLILFVVIFVVNKSPSDLKKSFTHSELASNFLGTMLKTSTGCKKTTFSDLFQDCAKYRDLSSISCGGEKVCVFLNNSVEMLLNNSLKEWNYAYNFTAITSGTNSMKITQLHNGRCDEKQSKIFPIPLHPGTLIIQLDICE